MEAKHSARAGSARAVEAGPERTEPRRIEDVDLPATPAQALALLEAGGLAPTWSRTFHHHTLDNGTTLYVDPATGQTYDTLPTMHDKDGGDV